jgi:hypothetical protein
MNDVTDWPHIRITGAAQLATGDFETARVLVRQRDIDRALATVLPSV